MDLFLVVLRSIGSVSSPKWDTERRDTEMNGSFSPGELPYKYYNRREGLFEKFYVKPSIYWRPFKLATKVGI